MKIWVNGTFDILHIGHTRLILHAASLGTLRVGLDTDERVRSKKGMGRPFNNLDDRMEFVSAIRGVESVVYFGSDNELIEKIKEWEPDIIVVGDEYKYKSVIGAEFAERVFFFEKIPDKSTTKILQHEVFSNWGKVF